jgi:hypothetical protein
MTSRLARALLLVLEGAHGARRSALNEFTREALSRV